MDLTKMLNICFNKKSLLDNYAAMRCNITLQGVLDVTFTT